MKAIHPKPPGGAALQTIRTALYVVAPTKEKRAEAVAELKAAAAERGCVLVRTYLDQHRAGPHLARLLADAAAARVDVVLLHRVAFLGKRSRLAALQVAQRLHACGVSVVSLAEPWFDVSSPVLAWIARDEQVRRDKSKRALEEKRARGEATGTPPLGHTRDEHGVLVDDPTELEMIARARELHADGYSLSAIARHLTALGYSSRSGAPLRHVWVGRALRR